MTVRVLLVGHGRMGRLVESLCPEHDMTCAGWIDREIAQDPDKWPAADVAIDFSTGPAVPVNLPRLAARGLDVVVGTTGWGEHEAALRQQIEKAGTGVVAAANFALGVNLFLAVAERTAQLMAAQPSFGAWIHELHHAAKRDAPSGTAIALESAMRRSGFDRTIDMASTRAGSIPGTHTLGFDSASETITLTHAARDRQAFAQGALVAAQWVRGRKGWFTMRDVLGL